MIPQYSNKQILEILKKSNYHKWLNAKQQFKLLMYCLFKQSKFRLFIYNLDRGMSTFSAFKDCQTN